MVVEGESGPDPAVCIAISPLRRADLAIKSPASDLFALCERTPARTAHSCPAGQLECYGIKHNHGGKGAGRSPSIRCNPGTRTTRCRSSARGCECSKNGHFSEPINVRLWLQADIPRATHNVRFAPNRCYEAGGRGFKLLRLFQRRLEGARCHDTVCSGYHSRAHTPCRA